MLSVVFVLEVPKSFMTEDDDDDVVARCQRQTGDCFQQRHAHKKHEQQFVEIEYWLSFCGVKRERECALRMREQIIM